jgi:hypothetical protein
MTVFIALALSLSFSVAAHAQESGPVTGPVVVPVNIVTQDQMIVTSGSLQQMCGYLAGDAKKQTVCLPDKTPIARDANDPDASIVVTSGMACTYSARGIACQGASYYTDIFTIPDLKNVFALVLPPYIVGEDGACALARDESGQSKVVCWGRNAALNEVPDEALDSPSVIATNGEDACVLTADQYIKCWGKNALGNSPYGVRDLRKLVVVKDAACTVDVYGLMCWGPKANVPQELATDGTVIDVAMIDTQICALTRDHKVVCFSDEPYVVPDGLIKPIALSSLYNTICATDVDGLKCWGPSSTLPSTAPSSSTSSSSTASPSHMPRMPWRRYGGGSDCLDPY